MSLYSDDPKVGQHFTKPLDPWPYLIVGLKENRTPILEVLNIKPTFYRGPNKIAQEWCHTTQLPCGLTGTYKTQQILTVLTSAPTPAQVGDFMQVYEEDDIDWYEITSVTYPVPELAEIVGTLTDHPIYFEGKRI
jgi:hypothetical protein